MSTLAKTPIIDRAAPIFGVCEALGDDFGISANWFRASLAPLILWQPLWTVVGYFLVGALVLATRLIFPDVHAPRTAAITSAVESEPVAQEYRLAA